MLTLFNSLGKRLDPFEPVNPEVVTLFTCGPSIYQRAHIGNFRTFLFEDILVRYLDHLGYRVQRGMNFTDIEDKALAEAAREGMTVPELTQRNIAQFLDEMQLLRIRIPEWMPRASAHVHEAAALIAELLDRGVAYRHGGNIYFAPLKFPGFGRLFGLDMSRWPARTRRFHRDTYPGTQWNRGDFILWHGYRAGDPAFWDTVIGRGRPSWNIQDPSMIASRFRETLSIYCGGVDNLYRHHDYSLAILESLRPYPMARFWLHGHHLLAGGRKMSKSKGTVVYTADLIGQGYSAAEIRFFLIYGHYRRSLSYTPQAMRRAAGILSRLRERIRALSARAGSASPQAAAGPERALSRAGYAGRFERTFRDALDADLDVKGAVDGLLKEIEALRPEAATPAEAAAAVAQLRRIDWVLNVLFRAQSAASTETGSATQREDEP